MKEEKFKWWKYPVGLLVGRNFTSLYKNRFAPQGVDASGFLEKSSPAKIIVIADGDIARNDVNPRDGSRRPWASIRFHSTHLLIKTCF